MGITRLDPAALAAVTPVPEGATMSRTVEAATLGDGLSAGVWSADPVVEEIPAYPVDEICVIIEGTLTLRTPDGAAQTFGPGDSFAIARGTACTWDQPTALTKFYVIREPAG